MKLSSKYEARSAECGTEEYLLVETGRVVAVFGYFGYEIVEESGDITFVDDCIDRDGPDESAEFYLNRMLVERGSEPMWVDDEEAEAAQD